MAGQERNRKEMTIKRAALEKNETHFIQLTLCFSVHKNPRQGPKSWADT